MDPLNQTESTGRRNADVARDERAIHRDILTHGMAGTTRVTMADEHEKAAAHHRERSVKAEQAADFFRSNPAFEDFINLIRTGAISI